MKATKFLLACCLAVACLPSFAAPVVLNFEDATTSATAITNNYSGFTFSSVNGASAYLMRSNALSSNYGSGHFYANPLDTSATAITDFQGNLGAVLLATSPTTPSGGTGEFKVTIADGFTGAFSVYFAGSSATVQAYSSDNVLLATASANAVSQSGCQGGDNCLWTNLGFGPLGTSVSYIELSGTLGLAYFDDMSFDQLGSNGGGGTTVPEPGSIVLSMSALGALAWTRKRVLARR